MDSGKAISNGSLNSNVAEKPQIEPIMLPIEEICGQDIWNNSAMGSIASGVMEVACWMITGTKQTTRIRALYLNAILRQDISFFDKETNSGEVVERMSSDTVLIQEAMEEKELRKERLRLSSLRPRPPS
ncbi:hypothetical protein RYX36_026854 [Vicia faba]